jgi:ankyrin repeat protein
VDNNEAEVVKRLAKTKRVLNGRVDFPPLYRDGNPDNTLGKWTALHECVRERNAEMAKILIENGAKLEIKDADGETPLFMASSCGNSAVVVALLDAGADPNAKAQDGWSCLMMAARDGDYDVTKALLQAGADLYDGTDMFGRNALHLADHFQSGKGGIRIRQGESPEQAQANYKRIYSLLSQYV